MCDSNEVRLETINGLSIGTVNFDPRIELLKIHN